MSNDSYTPQHYTKIEKVNIENCYFCLNDECCDMCRIFKKLVENWTNEDKEKNKE